MCIRDRNPSSTRLVNGCGLRLDFIRNECIENGSGVSLSAGKRSSENCQLNARILHNTIVSQSDHSIECIGGTTPDEYKPRYNKIQSVIAGNRLVNSGRSKISLCAFQNSKTSNNTAIKGNSVTANIVFNLDGEGAAPFEEIIENEENKVYLE